MRRLLTRTLLPMAGLAFACGGEEAAGRTSRLEEAQTFVQGRDRLDRRRPGWQRGKYSSLAVGPDGRRHVTYFDGTNEDLKYAVMRQQLHLRRRLDQGSRRQGR